MEQLLTHRGGLADFFGPEFNSAPKDRFASNADYFNFVSSLPPTFAPGERNQYCNGCYIALGAIVEKVSGMPYEKYVAENIFGRAEMTSTGYPRTDRPEPDIALGYTRRDGDGLAAQQHRDARRHRQRRRRRLLNGARSADLCEGGAGRPISRATMPNMGIAGGAPGTNAIVEARGEWVVIVLTNFDPPTGERIGISIADALQR